MKHDQSVKRVVVGLALAGIAVFWVRAVFVEGRYLIAAMWSLLLLWLLHPSGHRAYLARRARGIPPGQTGFNAFSKTVFGAMIVLTLVRLHLWTS